MEKPDLLARKRTQGRGDLSLYVGARKSAENVERKGNTEMSIRDG